MLLSIQIDNYEKKIDTLKAAYKLNLNEYMVKIGLVPRAETRAIGTNIVKILNLFITRTPNFEPCS